MSRFPAVLRATAIGLLWLGAVALFVLSPAIGSVGSIIAVAVMVFVSPAALPVAPWSSGHPVPSMLTTAFVALAVCLVGEVVLYLTARLVGIEMIEITLGLLLLGPLAVLYTGWPVLRQQPAMLLFLAAFASLGVCFVATARQPGDVLFVTNFLGLLLAPLVYLLARRHGGSRAIATLATLALLGALAGALTGAYDVFLDHKARAVGWGSGGNLMARSVVPLGFMALAGVIGLRSRWRWLFLLGPVFALYALALTQTRGVFVAVPVLALLAIWMILRDLRVPRLWSLAGVVVILIAVAAVALQTQRFLDLATLLERVVADPASVGDSSTTQRMAMWSAGWTAFLKQPLVGWGWAHLGEAALPYVLSMYHNDFFNAAVAAGVVGIVAWLATLVAPVVGILVTPHDRYDNVRLYAGLLLSVSLLIFGLTDMTFGYDLPTTLHAFLTAIVLGAFREPEPSAEA